MSKSSPFKVVNGCLVFGGVFMRVLRAGEADGLVDALSDFFHIWAKNPLLNERDFSLGVGKVMRDKGVEELPAIPGVRDKVPQFRSQSRLEFEASKERFYYYPEMVYIIDIERNFGGNVRLWELAQR